MAHCASRPCRRSWASSVRASLAWRWVRSGAAWAPKSPSRSHASPSWPPPTRAWPRRRQGLQEAGPDIQLGVKIASVTKGKKDVTIAYADAKGAEQSLTVDRLIVSIGRVPNTVGLNPEAVGPKLDERGAIVVDGDCRTNLPGVWAVGDVVRGPCSRTRPRKKGGGGRAHCWPARARQLQHHPFGSSTPAPRSPGLARPSSSSRAKAWPAARRAVPVPGQRPRAGAG